MSDEDRIVRDERRRAKRLRRRGRRVSPEVREHIAPESEAVVGAPEAPVRPLEHLVIDGKPCIRNALAGSVTTLLDSSERVVLTISYGQSNAEAGGMGKRDRHQRLATPGIVDEHRAMMLNSGLLGVQEAVMEGASLTDIVPAREDESQGESGGSAYLRYSLACDNAMDLPGSVHLYRTAGQKGQPLVRLQEGAQPFRNFLTSVERSRSICRLYGKSLWMPHFFWDHGEANRKRRTNPEKYRTGMVALRQRLDHLVRACTGQPEPVWMLVTILVAPGKQVASSDSEITLAQMSALSEPGVAPVCSPYWFEAEHGFSDGQAVHWSPLGKAFLREFGARAARIVREAVSQNPDIRLGELIHRQIYDPSMNDGRGGWSRREAPFETSPRTAETSIKRNGNEITGNVVFAEHGLQVYVGARGAAENLGFEWTGVGQITSVEVENQGMRSTWKVVLSEGSSGRLSYATALQRDAPSDSGAQKWGNLFDKCAEPSLAIPGMTLKQGMLPFSVAVE